VLNGWFRKHEACKVSTIVMKHPSALCSLQTTGQVNVMDTDVIECVLCRMV